MWQPEASWRRLQGGRGASSAGVWLAERQGRPVVVKRLVAPLPGDPPELLDPAGPGWWRREADVALSGIVAHTPGLRSPEAMAVEADDEGVAVVWPHLPEETLPGLYVARALGRFAGAGLPDRPWLTHGQLRSRLQRVAFRGGWRTLARTTLADVAHHLWTRRDDLLARLDALPQVPQHGDPVPGNMHARHGDDVLALDWSTLGRGPVGGDLGYWSLSAREELDPLLDAYLGGLPPGVATRDEVLLGARVTAVYTVLTRAEWALARVSAGEGALAGKFRHPGVAPYLRSLQRQLPQVEALLG